MQFYKRIAGLLADANNGHYTICVHNSESAQIPTLTFATHFLNGEGLRQASSSTFHFGKDILDTYTIADFASEHSSLPWGVTSSIYIPADPLAPQYGGDKEGGNTPQEKYKFRMTKAAMAGALIHNTIPSDSRIHFGWYDKLIRFYEDFKVNQAEFMPYWRKQRLCPRRAGQGHLRQLLPPPRQEAASGRHLARQQGAPRPGCGGGVRTRPSWA